MKGKNQGGLGELLAEVFERKGKTTHMLIARMEANWGQIVGEQMALKTRPSKIEKQTLWVETTDAGWAHQLQFLKEDIITAVCTYLDTEKIIDVRFKATGLPPKKTQASGASQKAAPRQPQRQLPIKAKVPITPPSSPTTVDGPEDGPASQSVESPEPPEKLPQVKEIPDPDLQASFAKWTSKLREKNKP